ncbi:MAG: type III secretion system chaperone [Minwuiales bacterium]|nr:type III secretion system chaperone [Minwuiales bacterium]
MIETYETVSEMLAELGPRLEVLEIAAWEEQLSWAIAVDGDTVLTLDYDAATAKLYIAAELGPPPQDRLPSTYDFLLRYNLCWAETDGVRMALDGPNGNVVQVFDISLHDLDSDKLGTVLPNFIALTRTMRAVVRNGISEPDSGSSVPEPHHVMIGQGSIQA